MGFTFWRRHFEMQAARPLPVADGAPELRRELVAPLVRSLARFQKGESGEGRIAHEIDRVAIDGIDDDYRAALKLFVREEGRHGRILGEQLRALGGHLLEETWTNRLFVVGRRMLGVRLKLVVLLVVAEAVSLMAYGALINALPPGALRRALEQIREDERAHLVFHRDFFATQTRTWPSRMVFSALVGSIGVAAGAVVLLDHGASFRALGIRLAPLAVEFLQVLGEGLTPALRATPLHEEAVERGRW
jgi:hypothetical protein